MVARFGRTSREESAACSVKAFDERARRVEGFSDDGEKRMLIKVVKWVSIPALLVASVFSFVAAGYEPLLNVVICMGAIIGVQRAVWAREYVWGAGCVAIVVAFSPVPLAVKIFLLMGLTCVAAFVTLFAAFRMRRLPVATL
jgi:hypothetical protein